MRLWQSTKAFPKVCADCCVDCVKRAWLRYTTIELTILLCGVAGIFILVASLFLPLGEADFETSATAQASLMSDDFLDAIEGVTQAPFQVGGTIEVLDNGDDFFPDLLAEIEAAQKSVTVTNYIWDDGDVGNLFFDALTKKASEGVEVRVLLDGLGGYGASEAHIEKLEQAGGVIAEFRPLEFGKLTRSHRRTHIRAIVIDGRVGYTGGVAFADAWLGNGTGDTRWRDLMFKADGAIGESIQHIFAALWRESTGEILVGTDFYDFDRSKDEASSFAHLLHTPSPDINQGLSQMIWLSVMGASESIYIETPYFLPDRNLMAALKAKAAEGVDIQVVLPGLTDNRLVQLAARTYYKELLDADIRLYEYQPGLLHTKTVVIDGHWSLIGSANLDSRSNILNLENLLAIDDESLATELELRFEEDRENATEIEKGQKYQSILGSLIGYASRIFVKQY